MARLKLGKIDTLLIAGICIGLAIAFFIVTQHALVGDEIMHYFTINNYCKFNFYVPDGVTTIPGYHFIASMFGQIGGCDKNFVRLLSLIIGAGLAILYFKFSRDILKSKDYKLKGLQCLLLPILLPFIFLVYTDTTSAFLVMLMMYFLFNGNYKYSALFGLLSIFIRQNNIIWVLFSLTYLFFDRKNPLKNISAGFLKKIYPFIIIFIVFVGFFVVNRGFAVGDRNQHPTLYIGFMNVYTMLFFLFWLNFPEHMLNIKKIFGFFRNSRILLATILLLALFYIFFILTFIVDHPYNQYDTYSWWLRNKLLHFTEQSLITKTMFFVAVAYTTLSLAVTKFRMKNNYLLFIFTAIFLIPSWLIEVRYYIIPILLINLFAHRERDVELSLVFWYFAVSFAYFAIFIQGMTFW